jgi:signal transduction histidine kinase
MMKKTKLQSIAVIFTLLLLTAFAYRQYQFYHKQINLTKSQLQLRTLRGRMRYFDEVLTMAARLSVLTGEQQWEKRYRQFQPLQKATFTEINQLIPGTYNGKTELESASAKLMEMESKAYDLVNLNHLAEAKGILFSKEYSQQKGIYALGLDKLTTQMDAAENDLFLSLQQLALHSRIVNGILVLSILVIWFTLYHFSKKWQKRLNEVYRKRAKDARSSKMILQKANNQLRLLSAHLQEIREKEKISIAYEIHEQACQQLVAISTRLDALEKSNNLSFEQMDIVEDITIQLNSVQKSLRKLSGNVFPGILNDLGLVEALESESEKKSRKYNINVIFTSEVESLELDKQIATQLFRIFQEKVRSLAFNGASEIICVLRLEDDQLILSINDDLINLSDNNYKHIEDIAIEERLNQIKGKLETSNSAEGNNISISIPYAYNQPAEVKRIVEAVY